MTPGMIPMLSPDGQSGDVPPERVQDAVSAGFKTAVVMTSPDGRMGYIPHDRAMDAIKAGFKIGQPAAQEPAPDEYSPSGFEHYQAPPLGQLAAGVLKSAPLLSGGLTGFEQGPQGFSSGDELNTAMTLAESPQGNAEKAGNIIGTTAQMLPLASPGVAATERLGMKAADFLPSAMKEQATKLFASVAQDANSVPVELKNAQDAYLRLIDWQKKTQLGPTLNKFLNRVTSPSQGPLTYGESRDFYQLLNDVRSKAYDGSIKMLPSVRYTVNQLVTGLKADIGEAAGQVGRAADYYKAMGDFAKASRLQEWYDGAKKLGWGLAKAALFGSVGGYAAKEGIQWASEK